MNDQSFRVHYFQPTSFICLKRLFLSLYEFQENNCLAEISPHFVIHKENRMKLTITRDQSKKMMGGVSFELFAKVELTGEEAELIKKYKAERESLVKKEIKIPLTGRSIVLNITIGDLVSGQSFKCNDIAEILETENNIKESCVVFKNYLEVMRHFGGQEVIQF